MREVISISKGIEVSRLYKINILGRDKNFFAGD
jgi:hypothetical protein